MPFDLRSSLHQSVCICIRGFCRVDILLAEKNVFSVLYRVPGEVSFSVALVSRLFGQLWVEERMPLAASTDHGHNLQTVQMLIKKNQVSHCPATRSAAMSARVAPVAP